ncbi:MAG: pyridoxal phosphate-dependent aminotransferase [Candidatus Kapaibacterium sp.]
MRGTDSDTVEGSPRTFTMQSLSRRVIAATESQTLAITARAKKLKQRGEDVVSLATGEPDFPTPSCAKHAAIEAIESDFSHYTDSNGIPELREAVADKFRRENGIIGADASTVLISCGAKHSIMNALSALCNPGDEVIVVAPYWVSYPAMVIIAEATPVVIDTTPESQFRVRPEQIRDALTHRTKCIILNSPSNPTGMILTREDWEGIVRVLESHDCYIISDEIYEKIQYDRVPHISPGSFTSIAHRVITVNGCSKAYAMTGWRVGFMNAPADVFVQAAKVQSQDTSNPTSIAQKAALSALLHADEDVERMRQEFGRRRELVCGLVDAIGGIRVLQPDGAFYLWIDLRGVLGGHVPTSQAFAERLLERHHCATVPGEAFGAPGFLRISFAASDEDIRRGVARLRECVEGLHAA